MKEKKRTVELVNLQHQYVSVWFINMHLRPPVCPVLANTKSDHDHKLVTRLNTTHYLGRKD